MKPVAVGSSKALNSQPLSSKVLVAPRTEHEEVNEKRRGTPRVVPGKGYPKTIDAAWQQDMGRIPGKAPMLTFDAVVAFHKPLDPTGAVGPNHYVTAFNSGFAIFDKSGNLLSPSTDLWSIGGEFIDEDLGDPIVQYDSFADRFIIMQFAGCGECISRTDATNGLLIAVSQGPDPVNDGWYTYRFSTNTFPDYPKLFIWSDGYYITTNQDPTDPTYDEVIYVFERDQMLQGEEAQQISLPLPGAQYSTFLSPAGFNAVGDEAPPKGNTPLIYFQDDSWMGVNMDHLKMWEINVDWDNPMNSEIYESQNLGPSEGVTPFLSSFDGGSFSNLSQPSGPDIDALQGAIMYPTSYRRFADHNSVVFNFVVDVDPSAVEHAGIRWYELRQDNDGGPWRVHQEGTYAPDFSDRWCGSIGMDKFGNIGLGFTILNDNERNTILPTLAYTGRYAQDPPGVMTIKEEYIAESTVINESSRYGDYSHLSIDPVDGRSFWFVGEYFEGDGRHNGVGVFQIESPNATDVGIVDIVEPKSAGALEGQQVTVIIRNFGQLPQTDIPVILSVDGETLLTETFSGTIEPESQVDFTLESTIELAGNGPFQFTAETNLEGDELPDNDAYTVTLENLEPNDIGVTVIRSPDSFTPSTISEYPPDEVVVTIENFGSVAQSNFEVQYSLNGGAAVTETVTGELQVKEEISYTFNSKPDISAVGVYQISARTLLSTDSDVSNDGIEKTFAHLNCIPVGSDCRFGDGIEDFYLGDIANENIYCTDGYYNFLDISTRLDRSQGTSYVGVSTGFASQDDERFSLWIDFNDNAVFDPNELLIDAEVIPSSNRIYTYQFSIPQDAPLGQHIMRVRAGDTGALGGGDLNNPCDVMAFGNTQDYTVIIESSIEESVLKDSDLVISSEDGDLFKVEMTSTYQRPLYITVFNLLGQKLLDYRLERSARGYEYDLDMSYVAPGVYLVRVGTRDEGRVKRIVVP